jgi:hypothetical protein
MFFYLWIRAQWAKITAEGWREVESLRELLLRRKAWGFQRLVFSASVRDVAKPAQPQCATVLCHWLPILTANAHPMSKWIDPVPDDQ